MFFKNYVYLLAIVFVITFLALGVAPVDRAVWIVEVTPIIIIFLIMIFTFKLFRFSDYAYTLMFFWMIWHSIGGHYTFANVPFDFVTDFFGFERNHFDRVGHFVIGFYAFASAELLTRKGWAHPFLATIFSFFFILSVAASYEIIEWLYAVIDGGNTGIEFLGSQGDIWDAQKDMLSDGLGAITSLILFWVIRPDLKIKELA
jgi:putative membrane protein